MELLIISFLVASYLIRNTAQDIIYKRRGEDPPYVVRQRERAAKRADRVPLADRGPASRFLAAIWEDAWEDAHEKRKRAHDKKQQKRRRAWELEDSGEQCAWQVGINGKGEAKLCDARREPGEMFCARHVLEARAADQAPKEHDETPPPVVHNDDTYVPGGGGTDPEQPPPHLVDFAKNTKCRDCGGGVQVEKDPETPGRWIVRTNHTDPNCPQNPERPTPRGQQDKEVTDPIPSDRSAGFKPGDAEIFPFKRPASERDDEPTTGDAPPMTDTQPYQQTQTGTTVSGEVHGGYETILANYEADIARLEANDAIYELQIATQQKLIESLQEHDGIYEQRMAGFRQLNADDATIANDARTREQNEQNLLAANAGLEDLSRQREANRNQLAAATEARDSWVERHGSVYEAKTSTGARGDQALYQ